MTRTRLMAMGGVLLLLLIAAAIAFWWYIQQLSAPKALEISYVTVQTPMPTGASCVGRDAEGEAESPGIAKEILNLATDDIYIAARPNPMPDDVWAGYRFQLPLLKNSTRNLLFQGSCFFRSPDVAADCRGDACFTLETLVDYSWLKLTTVMGNTCYPDTAGCKGDQVAPGYVSINTIAKCHRMVFDGPAIYELVDGQGNRYVMHATATGVPDVTGPTLPPGWTLTERLLDTPLVLLPFGGGDACYYNVVRDNLVQAYHQFAYAGDRYPRAE